MNKPIHKKSLLSIFLLLAWWTALAQSNPYIQVLSGGNVKYSVTFSTAQAYVEVFVRKNNVQIIAQNIVSSGVANGNGTYTYSLTSAASNYQVGDQLQVRFYSYAAGQPGVFTPGPTETTWSSTLTYGNSNTPPTVSITSPGNNTSSGAPVSIFINANASDVDGSVTKVEFFNGATKLGEDLSSPYSFYWASIPVGSYTLTAKATDNQGAVTTSSVVNYSVVNNIAPTVNITSPANNATFGAPASVTINATASDADGTITKVVFLNNENPISEDVTSPYSYTFTGLSAGTYTFKARAFDNLGGYSTATVTVNVTNGNIPPTVSITSPGTSTVQATINLLFTANASDSDGSVTKVEFFNGATKLGEDLTSPYSFLYNNLPLGTHSITAKATDNQGAVTTSSAVIITAVDNILPTVAITAPANNATFNAPASFSITATASDQSGTISKVQFYNGTTLLGEDLAFPYSYSISNLGAGTYTFTAKATDNLGGTTTSAPITVVVIGQAPYGGTAWAIPGTIEAENYDLGGQGIAYNDLSTGNSGGSYRSDAVDIFPNTIGGHHVGNVQAGEWLEYTVNIPEAGSYNIEMVAGNSGADQFIRLELDGQIISYHTIYPTGGAQLWNTTTAHNIMLTAGQKVVRLVAVSGGFNLDKMIFEKNGPKVVRGLAVMVEYTDAPFPESEETVTNMLNQPGFNLWGLNGSVKDYFYTLSNGKVDITSTVVKVSLPYPKSYHFGPNKQGHDVPDIVAAINQKYPNGFQNLTVKSDNSLLHFTILNRAGIGGYAFNSQGIFTIKNNGQDIFVGSGTMNTYSLTQTLETAIICHEMGHIVFEWPDLYQIGWSNLGSYCLMSSPSTIDGPMAANPALRYQKNWFNEVIEIGNTTQTYTATSNSYTTIYKYTNPINPREYLLIHPVVHGKYYLNRPYTDQGLSIFYVDEDGGMDLPGDELDYFVTLVQADNMDELHDPFSPDRGGDQNDMYDNIYNTFPNGTPFRWKDGGEFGLFINNISAPGATMTFTVNARPNTFLVTSDKTGTVSPLGVISAANGETKTFTLKPYSGYELDQVKVNGVAISVSGNTFSVAAAGTKTIHVSYKRKATLDPVPAPWSHADIGVASTSGVSGAMGNEFYLESYGEDIGNNSDKFRYVYTTLSGDGKIEGRLSFANKPKRWSKAGFMIRESLAPDAAFSMIMFTPRNYVKSQHRTSNGGWAEMNAEVPNPSNYNKLYKWFRLVRIGNEITTYCSKDRITWVTIGQATVSLSQTVLVGMVVTGVEKDYPSRALFDNVTVGGLSCNLGGTKLTGTVIGTSGSWANSGNTKEKAFDNNTNTYFDAPTDVAWTGLNVGSLYRVTGIRFFPRQESAQRMVGGKFQGSNTADFSSGVVDLYTITTEPPYDWSCISVNNTSSFRYIRYISPTGGFGNVAEIQFYGTFAGARLAADATEETSLHFTAYPNPFNEQTTIAIPSALGEVEVQVYNSAGLMVSKQKATDSFTLGSDLEKGLYLIKIITPEKTETLKVMKSN